MRGGPLFLFLLPVLFLAPHATAQVQFGLRAGLNVSNWLGENVGDNSAKLGLIAGPYARYDLTPRLHIQPEVLYSQKGSSQVLDEEGDEITLSVDYIDVPLVLGFTVSTGSNMLTRLYAGPQLSVKLGEYVKSGTIGLDVDRIKSTDFGITFGADTGARRVNTTSEFGLGLRYTLGLTRVVDVEGFTDPKPVKGRNARTHVFSVTGFFSF